MFSLSLVLGLLSRGQLELDVHNTSYEIKVNGEQWLKSAPIRIHIGGQWYSSGDGSLKLTKTTHSQGTDAIGAFKMTNLEWDAPVASFMTSFKAYSDAIVFEQSFPVALNDTSINSTKAEHMVLSAFPSFDLSSDDSRGFLAFGGGQLEDCFAGPMAQATSIPSGTGGGGPIALFDAKGQTTVISAASSFMSSNIEIANAGNSTTMSLGLMGSVTALPAEFSYSSILTLDQGVTRAMKRWGDLLRGIHGKGSAAHADVTLQYLGTSTDNGAFYYGISEPGKTMEQTMVDVQQYAKDEGIPYKYALLDSWWYTQGKGGGVKNWTAKAKVFPDGISGLRDKTGWEFQLHNRYWASDNVYAKQNNGSYDFMMDPKGSLALPTEQLFWDELMHNASEVRDVVAT
jgi:hypothetical protein